MGKNNRDSLQMRLGEMEMGNPSLSLDGNFSLRDRIYFMIRNFRVENIEKVSKEIVHKSPRTDKGKIKESLVYMGHTGKALEYLFIALNHADSGDRFEKLDRCVEIAKDFPGYNQNFDFETVREIYDLYTKNIGRNGPKRAGEELESAKLEARKGALWEKVFEKLTYAREHAIEAGKPFWKEQLDEVQREYFEGVKNNNSYLISEGLDNYSSLKENGSPKVDLTEALRQVNKYAARSGIKIVSKEK